MNRWLAVIRYQDPNGAPYFAPLQYPSDYPIERVVKSVKDWAYSLRPGWRFESVEIWKELPDPLRVIGEGELVAISQGRSLPR